MRWIRSKLLVAGAPGIERRQAEDIAKVVSHGDACPRPRPEKRAATKVALTFKEAR